MRVYALVIEIPTELETFVEPEDIDKNSALKLILEMQSRYTFGISTQVTDKILKLMFPKEAERDFAYNELMNNGHDAIRMFHPCAVPDDSFTDEAQKRYRRDAEKDLKKTARKIARKMR